MNPKPIKCILIIEDEADITMYLTAIFEDSGYKVETAANGTEAMHKIKKKRPDLISLDISLPERTGVNIYCELKEDPVLAAIPVVMVTGIQKEFQRYIDSRKNLPPPDGYISKPFQASELINVVSKLLNAHK